MSQNLKVKIAPSILSADFARLGQEVQEVEKAGCEIIHVDVMDGHFVPNLTIGPLVVKALRKVTRLPLDVHLMIDEPIRYVEDFAKAGSDWLTIHVEATQDVSGTLRKIKECGMKTGLSLRPGTAVEALEPYLDGLDLILVMSVEPGFGGQAFMPEQMQKVTWLKQRFKGEISVDGGVNRDTYRTVVDAGATILVAGSAVFGAADRRQAIEELRG